MANRYFTTNSQRKLSGSEGGHQGKSGSVPSMKEKPAFPSAGLPGKAQSKNRGAGGYKCHMYPKSEGL
jgi:hypothetical protein